MTSRLKDYFAYKLVPKVSCHQLGLKRAKSKATDVPMPKCCAVVQKILKRHSKRRAKYSSYLIGRTSFMCMKIITPKNKSKFYHSVFMTRNFHFTTKYYLAIKNN